MPGCLLHLLLQSQGPSLQRPLKRRERRHPKGRGGKLRLELPAENGDTNTEQPRKLRAREMPSGVCASWNAALLLTVQPEMLFLLKF